MSKKQAKKTRASASLKRMSRSKTIIAGAIIVAPMIAGVPTMAYSQQKGGNNPAKLTKQVASLKWANSFLKISDKFTIVGMDNGNTVYRKAGGQYCTFNPRNGDLMPVESSVWLKYSFLKNSKGAMLKMVKFPNDWYKEHSAASNVKLEGFDASGHLIQQNNKGEMFYVDPFTGDFSFMPK